MPMTGWVRSSKTTPRDLPAFARYARTDARLALSILEQLDLFNLAVARSRLTGMPPDRGGGQHRVLRLSLSRRTEQAPHRGAERPQQRFPGARGPGGRSRAGAGYGTARRGMGIRFKSLYPSVIRTYNIDPLGFVRDGEAVDDPINSPAAPASAGTPAFSPVSWTNSFPGGSGPGAMATRWPPRPSDPHEFLLRRTRHTRLPLLPPGHRQRHHRPRDASCCSGRNAGSRIGVTGFSTATRTACSLPPAVLRESQWIEARNWLPR